MAKFKDISGQKFSHLTAIRRVNVGSKRGVRWLCSCDCGNTVEAQGTRLRTGKTVSCGCKNKPSRIVHGLSNTAEHKTWSSMIRRCYNKNSISYKDYGAKGVTVSKEWLGKKRGEGFLTFLGDMGERPSSEYSIDRIDTYKGYSKENCRWATTEQQANNKSDTVYVTFSGLCMSVSQWAHLLGMKANSLGYYINKGTEPGVALGFISETIES